MRSRYTGLPAWLVQRASAVCMLLFLVFVLSALWLHPRPSYVEWRSWMSRPGVSVVVLVFFVALLSHIWVGLRDVLLDYARPAGLRRLLLGALGAGLLGTAAWVVSILLRVQH
ncbi:MAG: succinate dehydrogenase, hydrophobic membrane anchor protein [Ramlibacter sp.]